MHDWHSISDPPPEGTRLLFYSPEWDYVFCGTMHDGQWFDEANMLDDGTSAVVEGVTHWRPMPESPLKSSL